MNLGWYCDLSRSYWNGFLFLRRKVMDELLKIQEEALAKISACADAKELNDLRVFYLGKKDLFRLL